ncbi:MAG: indole-3-glycerol phosphate synthase TrpC [Myxococcota bacterium]|nr:indole-3-glycerol phosphate synthase TrpC [Myxococcota bacterium]MEE2780463.1 indole-3-glycerol phosphate synthase TrpC [Myxococcota bacterium]
MSPSDTLSRILDTTRAALRESPPDEGLLHTRVQAQNPPVDTLAALGGAGLSIIAEIKRRSPSEGDLRGGLNPVDIATGYAEAGAAAISVLTEPAYFGGSLEDLSSVSNAVSIPCLRKDFIVDPIQVLEARASGASLVLLIVAALEDGPLRDLRESIETLGMEALVEAHTADEVRRAVDAGSRIIGVNNRDLSTFNIDLGVAETLRPLIPTGVVTVAESGIYTEDDLGRMVRAGYDACLIGSSLMRSTDPTQTLRDLLASANP